MGGTSVKCQLNRSTSFLIDWSLVEKIIKDMKTGKASGPSGIFAEMLKISGGGGYGLVTCIVDQFCA